MGKAKVEEAMGTAEEKGINATEGIKEAVQALEEHADEHDHTVEEHVHDEHDHDEHDHNDTLTHMNMTDVDEVIEADTGAATMDRGAGSSSSFKCSAFSFTAIVLLVSGAFMW